MNRTQLFRTMFAVAVLGSTAGMAHAEPKAAPVAPAATTVPTRTQIEQDATRFCVLTTRTGSFIRAKECRTRAQWLRKGFDPYEAK